VASLDVLNWKNEVVGKVEIPDAILGREIKVELLNDIVNWQLACRRQGTHMTKTRGLVSGGGKKPFKQKGTGNARQGSNRSPLMPGGGKVFGPQPRNYGFSMPKKLRRAALSMVLAYLYKNDGIKVVDSIDCSGKTRELKQSLDSIGVKSAFLISSEINEMTRRASKNLVGVKYAPVVGFNVFEALKLKNLVISKDSVPCLIRRLTGNQEVEA
jgi:large subunit ribosomal protein L4